MMHETLQRIGAIGVVPVIKIDDAKHALPLADALAEGGLPCVEITFRTAAGAEALRQITKYRPKMLAGAGTVLTTEQAKMALEAGADFLVSPGLNPKVVGYSIGRGALFLPGCANPSDVEAALEFSLEAVKFFPAEEAGGLRYIKAIAAPYGGLRFMPTGGITLDNLGSYLSAAPVLACGGSYMATAAMINGERWDDIIELCRRTAGVIREARKEITL